jgi:hypothetical protein
MPALTVLSRHAARNQAGCMIDRTRSPADGSVCFPPTSAIELALRALLAEKAGGSAESKAARWGSPKVA